MKEKVDLSSFSNPEYDPGRNVLTRGLWYACNALIFKSYLFPFYRLKWFLLKVFGAKIGNGLIVKPGVSFKYPWKLEIGNHVWIGEGAWIDNLDQVVIGDNVCISQGAMLLCGNHDYKKPSFDLITAPIIIEAGAWIAQNLLFVLVCKSVSRLF
ncbi:MAG: hypothetical protein R2792_03915 [Saprospiraceae bacterium]